MALEQDALLVNNGIVRSYNTTELYCMLCESDTSYATYTKHIASLSHQQNLQWFCPIFRTCGNDLKCAVCNTVIAWEKLKIHSRNHIKIPWSTNPDDYDKYKIFFENQIFQWKNLFHCCLCADTFSSCEVALIHMTDPKHQTLKEKTWLAHDSLIKMSTPWDSIVREGLVTFNATQLQCRFCGCKSVTFSSVGKHIKGLAHLSNKSRFELKLKESEITESVTTVFTQDSDVKKQEDAKNEAIACTKKKDVKVNEDRKQDPLKLLDFIFKQNDSTCYCIICDQIVLNEAKNDHITANNHVANFKRYGCEAVTQKNTTDFYCGHCDCKISSVENLYPHIRGKKHNKALKTIMANTNNISAEIESKFCLGQNSPCNYIVRINVTDVRCRVCDCIISAAAMNIEIHLTGKHHIKSLKKYGCERITLTTDNNYHCGWCDVIISDPQNVYNHIKEATHLYSLAVAKQRNLFETMKFPSQAENSQQTTDVKTIEISNKIISPQQMGNYQSPKIGARATTDNSIKKIPSNSEIRNDYLDLEEKQLETVKISKTAEKNLAFHHIIKLANMVFFCRICDCNIVPPLTVDAHVAEKRHRESHDNFFNEISEITNDRYYCKCCNWTIYGTDDIYTHLQGNKHKQSLDTSNTIKKSVNASSSYHVGLNIKQTSNVNSINVDENHYSKATINMTNNGKDPREQINVQTMNMSRKTKDYKETVPKVHMMKISSKTSNEASDAGPMKKTSKFECSDVWGLACRGLSCNYVTDKPSGSYCEICDVQLNEKIGRHVSTSQHLDSLKKYGCDNVSLLGDCYYCACCEYNFNGCENVYMHVKARKHLLRSEAMAAQRKLDTLQKKINKLQTTEPGAELSSVLYSITADISSLLDQLKRNSCEQIETN